MQSNYHTLLFTQHDAACRVDMLVRGDKHECVGVWLAPHPPVELGEAVVTAARLDKTPKGNVWILTEEAWTGTVCLSRDLARSLTGDELDQALALEAEFDSGIPPLQSTVCAQRQAVPTLESVDDSNWSVLQIENDTLADLESSCAKSGIWITGIGRSGGDQVDPLDDLLTTSELPADRATCTESDASQIAAKWLVDYLADPTASPLIRPANAQLAHRRERKRLMWTGIAAALLCLGVHASLFRSLTQQTLQQSKLAAHLADGKSELADSLTRSTVKQTKLDELLRQQNARAVVLAAKRERVDSAENQRRAVADLLDALHATAEATHWIQSIQTVEQDAILTGLAISAADVIHLAASLQADLRTKQVSGDANPWRVSVESTQFQGELVKFQLQVSKQLSPMTTPQISLLNQRSRR